MKKSLVLFIVLFSAAISVSLACESNQYLDGYNWTFHRMDDGNKFHEVQHLGEFTEGDTLSLSAPCPGRHVDSIQIDWEDNHSEVRGELVILPGNRRLGTRDISGKKRVTWAVQSKMNRFRIEFSGKRGHRCRVRFIRVFYGNKPYSNLQQQGQNAGLRRYKLVDQISLAGGLVARKARVLKWENGKLHVVIKNKGGRKLRQINPNNVTSLSMPNRWGQAVAKDGTRFPVRINSMNGVMIQFDKRLNGNIVPKPLTDINNFTSIIFND